MNIIIEGIRAAATNGATYSRGLDYYRRGMVRGMSVSAADGVITARVRGNDDYTVEIYLDADGHIDDAQCTCPAFDEYSGYCKHIIAALFEAKNRYGNDTEKNQPLSGQTVIPFPAASRKPATPVNPAYAISKELVSDVLRGIGLNAGGAKEHITLKAMLYKDISPYSPPRIELEAGISRLYKVKDMDSFLEAIIYGRELEFGKQFTFSPKSQEFRPGDQPLADFLLDAYYDERNIGSRGYYYSSAKKTFTLNSSRFKRFLDIAANMEHAYWQQNNNLKPVKIEVSHDPLPVSFKLNDTDNTTQLELVMGKGAFIHSIIPSNEVFISGDRFFIPPKENTARIMPFFLAFGKNACKPLPLTDNDAATFLTEIYPVLKSSCNMDISPGLAEKLHAEPLISSVWFDRHGDGISAKTVFKYGDIEFNPLETGVPPGDGSRFVVRDKGGEDKLLNLLRSSGFTSERELMALYDEDNIYDFLTDRISMLTEFSEVYYSESFGRLKAAKPPRLSGSVRLTEDSDLLEISFNIGGIDASEIERLISALKEKKRFVRLKNGSFIPVDSPELASAAKLIEQLELSGSDVNGKIALLPKYRAMYLDNAIKEYGREHFSVNSPFKEMVKNIKEPHELDYQAPESLNGILRDYQKSGFKWLKALSYYGFGGILADDMGLGKTIQAISLVVSDYEHVRLPSLIIAPTSLVYNWQEEIEKFAPQMSVLVLDGSRQERLQLHENISQSAFVITSYPLIRRDIEEIKSHRFAFCFLDEAQHIKNPVTINARSVKQVNARRFFALTGTPIENSLTELWSIFDFLMPGYLYSHNKFQSMFETPIVKYGDKSALSELGRHIRPFILRRLKRDVLSELPEKIETRMLCDMTDEQKMIYLSYLSKARSEFEDEVSTSGFDKSRIKILALLTRLRQICCHPSSFLEGYNGGSGKLDLLEEIVGDSVEGGHRLLLFSQFTSILEIIRKQLVKNSISYSYIDGQIPSGERMKLVHAFNSGKTQVFLISLKAGGTGLNLTGADTVIHFDPWWNPAVEDQATDRAHRIGQEKTVQVFRLVTRGTIEEKIFALQQKKRALVDSVIQPGENFLGKMTLEEVRNLFV